MKSKLLLPLLFLSACQSGGTGDVSTTQNILHCENYGAISETISTTTTNEAANEPEEGTDGTTETGQSDIQSSESTSATPENTGLQPVVPGLGIGTIKSYVEASDEQLQRCESEATCQVLGFDGGKALVEHCVGITFPSENRQ